MKLEKKGLKDEGRKGRKNEVAYEHEAFLISNLIRIVVRRSKREARANRQGPRCHAHVLHFTIVQRSALPERRTWLLLDYSSINLPPPPGLYLFFPIFANSVDARTVDDVVNIFDFLRFRSVPKSVCFFSTADTRNIANIVFPSFLAYQIL